MGPAGKWLIFFLPSGKRFLHHRIYERKNFRKIRGRNPACFYKFNYDFFGRLQGFLVFLIHARLLVRLCFRTVKTAAQLKKPAPGEWPPATMADTGREKEKTRKALPFF